MKSLVLRMLPEEYLPLLVQLRLDLSNQRSWEDMKMRVQDYYVNNVQTKNESPGYVMSVTKNRVNEVPTMAPYGGPNRMSHGTGPTHQGRQQWSGGTNQTDTRYCEICKRYGHVSEQCWSRPENRDKRLEFLRNVTCYECG